MGDPVEAPTIPPILVAQAGSATVPTRPGVARPVAPSPPKVTAPTIATPAPSDWPGRALAMVKQLGNPTKLDDVRTAVGNLTKDERDAIDTALLAFPKKQPKLVAQAYLLRRLIRIARNPPTSASAHAQVKATGGTAVQGDDPNARPNASKRPDARKKVDAVPVFSGAVTFRTGVDVGTGRQSSGYSLTYAGSATTDLRWLQFIWRMVVVDYKDTGARLTSSTAHFRTNNKDDKPFLLTTDPASPRWSVDTTKHGLGPFYEEFVNRSPTELALFDAPGPSELVDRLFRRLASPSGEKLTAAPKHVVEHFRAATYLVNGLDVLYRANIHFIWDFTSSTEPAAVLDPSDKPSWALVGKLDAAHRAVLQTQYPLTDYLPGDRLGPPVPFDAFEPVPALDEVEYGKATDNGARYRVIADLASARMVPAVVIEPTLAINGTPRDVQAVRGGTAGAANQGLKPGLNLTPPLSAGGETGVLDTQGNYHNPDMPTDRDGEPPSVAIKLGNPALESVASAEIGAISTMRHEMLHATHYHVAIGWLLAWRDELTTESFGSWLARQRKPGNRPTPVDAPTSRPGSRTI